MQTNPFPSDALDYKPDSPSLPGKNARVQALLLLDAKGTIVNWNSEALRLFGFAPEEILGRSASFLNAPEETAMGIPEKESASALEKGRGGGEGTYRGRDGATFRGSSVVYPLLRVDGQSSGFVKLIWDSRDEQDASEAFLASARKVESVLDNLKDHAIFMIDSEGIISSWNLGSESVFGFKNEEVLGKSFSTIFTPEDVQAGIPERELETARTKGKAEDERWHQRKDGTRFWASGAVIPLAGDTAHSRFIKVVRDATDRKRAEDADRMESIGRLAGGVAHDYNNILTSIIGYCELAEASTPEDSPQKKWLSEALASAHRAEAVTQNLLAFSRKQMISPERTNPNTIIRNLHSRLRSTLGGRIQVVIHLDPDVEDVLLDRFQIEQVLMNLALNAKEAMPEGGIVTLSTLSAKATTKAVGAASVAGTASGASAASALNIASASNVCEILPGPSGAKAEAEARDFVALTFKDNGKGMDAETAAHAFDPFFSTKAQTTGSVGLGLSTAYGVIQQSGGTITLSSLPGAGTEFEIHLPVISEGVSDPHRAAEPPVQFPIVRNGKESQGRGAILLVEDEGAVRRLLAEVLRKSGFQVLEAKDGEEGLTVFNARPQGVDIVVSDVVMPRLGGLAMARRILYRQPDVPILFMSGYSEDPFTALNMPGSKCLFLHKPFSVKSLLAKVEEAVLSMQGA
ncbi:MAG: sensor hybrid histidine kinase [Fibrobacteres bacterium]|nr:sensor hybrid histidine kinase [Fibrobacterota bacterium]